MGHEAGLVVVWTSRDREAALKMALPHARKARENGLWQRVILIVWGPSAKMLACDLDLREAVAACRRAGVETFACRESVADYGLAEQFRRYGLTLIDADDFLAGYMKEGWQVLTV
ncbi:DsrE family protein [Desulfovibrio sp. JY]|uniref:DsrE family protein n=1 Tax=Solidesulfovibrio sp. C21 TaxID=3398613 RepID=UPI0039FC3F9F|nr:DsrE family protein [Desulfovibrio sp. JY]